LGIWGAKGQAWLCVLAIKGELKREAEKGIVEDLQAWKLLLVCGGEGRGREDARRSDSNIISVILSSPCDNTVSKSGLITSCHVLPIDQEVGCSADEADVD